MNQKFNLQLSVRADLTNVSAASKTICIIPVGELSDAEAGRMANVTGSPLSPVLLQELQKESSSLQITEKQEPLQVALWHSVDIAKKFTPAYFRNYLAGQVKNFNAKYLRELIVIIPEFALYEASFISKEYFYQTFVEGVLYGNYTYNAYKSDNEEPKTLAVTFITDDLEGFGKTLDSAQKIMSGVELTRNLQNQPACDLYPETFVTKIEEAFAGLPVEIEVLDETAIQERNMGGLYGVGKGSARPPRFVVLRYKPEAANKHVALVGKGVTFDTGGISIKPAADMGEMKGDMSGAAVVTGSIFAAAKLKLPVQITGIMPLAENMPSSKAMRPGDILTTSSGKTIEVDNTDAEGRLILADALHYAKELKPDTILDFATLTGACVVALGEFVAGLFTANDSLANDLFTTGMETDERVWRMPMWDEYNQLIKSDVADVKNIGGRWGGAITAAKFLEHWAGKEIPWAHIDIAGPACPHKYNAYTDTYFTGFGVRLVLQYLNKLS